MEKIKAIRILFVLGAFLCFLPTIAGAAVIYVNCPTGSIQTAINNANSGDTIAVCGTCNENVDLFFSLTLDGNYTGAGCSQPATIHSPDATQSTVAIEGISVTLKNFYITGGITGVLVSGNLGGGQATIDSNTITDNETGIGVNRSGYANIINNTIQNNSMEGIMVYWSGTALIGAASEGDTSAKPNTIQNNASAGVKVKDSSSAKIVGNTISNNKEHGIWVEKGSQADISGNDISGNTGDGIHVKENSGVNLGGYTGTTIFDSSNTTTVNNTGIGIGCHTGGYVDGPFGTVNGAQGQTVFTNLCVRSLDDDSSVITVNADYFGGPSWAKLYGVANNNNVGIAFDSFGDSSTIGGGGMFRFARGSWTSKTAVQNGDRLGFFAFSGYDGTTFLNTAALTAKVDGSVSAGNVPTKFVFETNTTGYPRPERMVISSSGNVGIGTSTPSYPLHMGSGAYVSTGGVWTDASSREYKDNIQALTTEETLDTLKELNPVKFAYKTDRTEKHLGFIAEEVPDLIATKDRKGLSPMDVVAVLTKVIQDQQKTISAHSEKIAELERALQLRGALTAVSHFPDGSLK